MQEAEHMSALQSWAPEMVNFVKLTQKPISDGMCDIIIDKPTYIMKLDASKWSFSCDSQLIGSGELWLPRAMCIYAK